MDDDERRQRSAALDAKLHTESAVIFTVTYFVAEDGMLISKQECVKGRDHALGSYVENALGKAELHHAVYTALNPPENEPVKVPAKSIARVMLHNARRVDDGE
jgi:hypothetical protein